MLRQSCVVIKIVRQFNTSASAHSWAIFTASVGQHFSVVKRLTPDGRLTQMQLRLSVKAMLTSGARDFSGMQCR